MAPTPRLEVGAKAPAFSLPDADGNTVKLSDYKGRKVIIYFYPAASTPGCTKQACDFRDSLTELNEAGLDVIGISPDKPEKLAKFRDNAEGRLAPAQADALVDAVFGLEAVRDFGTLMALTAPAPRHPPATAPSAALA